MSYVYTALAAALIGAFVTLHLVGDWNACRSQHYVATCLVKAW